MNKCKHCGNLCKRIFCNQGCYFDYKRKHVKKSELPKNRKCIKCGKGFYASPGHVKSGWGKYCSLKCRALPKHGNAKGGKRKDLGIYVRSSWEANYARYLNLLVKLRQIEKWDYEPDTFHFDKIKRGTRFYTPDFKVTENNGNIIYHEVKGYMSPKSKTQLKRMAKYYPEVNLIIIGNKEMKNLKSKLGNLIAWENNKNDKIS